VVALWLVWGAVHVLRDASNHLLDTGLPIEARARIVQLATGTPGIAGVHQLRTRVAGPYVLMQMHADLDPYLTLEAAHAILVEAEKRILAEFPAADIIIHPIRAAAPNRTAAPFTKPPRPMRRAHRRKPESGKRPLKPFASGSTVNRPSSVPPPCPRRTPFITSRSTPPRARCAWPWPKSVSVSKRRSSATGRTIPPFRV
jgi:hypothetical protein